MNIIGVNCFHADSSAALLSDGKILCATEEERFKRIKHWAGFPLESINFCLNFSKKSITDIDFICIGRDPKAKFFRKIFYSFSKIKSAKNMLFQRFLNRNDLKSVRALIEDRFGFCPPIKYIEHHRSHLASAFYSSPFNESTIISIDGSGDFSTIMIGKGKNNKIEIIKSVDFPKSMGLVYTAFTQYLGFPYYGDEYKVMGLSPYGNPKYLKELESIFWFDNDKILDWNPSFFNLNNGAIHYENNIPVVPKIFSNKFNLLFNCERNSSEKIKQVHMDLACSLQRTVEKVIFQIVEKSYKMTKSKNLCIAGGVAQNSVANGKILNNTSFENLYIPSAGHDAGISMGSAQYHFFNNLGRKRVDPLFDANLGIEFTNSQIKEILDFNNIKYNYYRDDVLFKYVAEKISNEKVVGFFDGQAEFGPRALGSRSILADPRNSDAQKLLNEKIKKRESFRPFAPSILEEYGSEFFEDYQFTPFMERVLKVKKNKRELIPAVTHVDGSGRLQSVRKSLRPRYYRLINEFYKITGIPILINTSFNENEPVVNSPIEAINCFQRTDLDILVLKNYVLEK